MNTFLRCMTAVYAVFWTGFTWGQYSNVETFNEFGGTQKQSAASILTDRRVDGRFGPMSSGGYLSPTPDANSRLNSGGIYTKSGGFIGINMNTPNSRFQEFWNNPDYQNQNQNSRANFDEYIQLLQLKREREKIAAEQSAVAEPQPIEATRPIPNSMTRAGAQAYYSSGQYQRDFQQPVVNNTPNTEAVPPAKTNPNIQNFRDLPINQQSQTWLRTPNAPNLPIGNQRPTGVASSVNVPQTNSTVPGKDLGSKFVGGMSLNSTANTAGQNTQIPNQMPIPTQDPTAAFQEYLELMLLRSPDVNPLSPIQVQFDRGTATIQGIVPTQSHKIAAGKILMSDPRVKTVNNKLTVLPTDPNAPLPPIFDPNLNKSK